MMRKILVGNGETLTTQDAHCSSKLTSVGCFKALFLICSSVGIWKCFKNWMTDKKRGLYGQALLCKFFKQLAEAQLSSSWAIMYSITF